MPYVAHVRSLRKGVSFVVAAVVVAAAALTAASPAAADGSTTRVSVSSSGAQTPHNNDNSDASMSADGRYVAFVSLAPNLVDGDTNGLYDVFVRDRTLGLTTRVSVGPGGVQANQHSLFARISAGGRSVAFTSTASNLVLGDTNGVRDSFVHDLDTGITERVSVGPAGVQATNDVHGPHLSADGRYVSMWSQSANLVVGDTNGQPDVFVHDRQTRVTTRASLAVNGAQSSQFHGYGSISDDGRWVAYHAFVPFAGGQTSIYLHDRVAGTTSLVGLANRVGLGTGDEPSLSSDGRSVTWVSDSPTLVPNDTNGARDVFVFDGQSRTTTRVSVDSAGAQANGLSRDTRISGDGRFVTFTSEATNLRPADTSSLADVFLHDRVTGVTSHVSSGPNGPANDHSRTGDIGGDGRFLSYLTRANNIVLGDTNSAEDVFVEDRGPAAETAPVISVDQAPAPRSNDTSPTFGFGTTVPTDFECSLALGTAAVPRSACTSPITYDNLVDGAYTFSVHAYNQAGFDRETINFTVDTVGPSVLFIQSGASPSQDTTPLFSFFQSQGDTYECSLSTGADAFSPCTSPVQYGEQPDGAYAFKVRATDLAGNTGPPRAHPFTIDTTGPVITIDEGPPAVSNDTTPTVKFSSEAGATYQCWLSTGSYTPCVSPMTYSDQPQGDYTFTVRSYDSLGNLGQPVAVTFRIDLTAPVTTLGEVPPAQSGDNTPAFGFTSEVGATFECSLSTAMEAFSACTSFQQYGEQVDGAYIFKVRATDLAGNTGLPKTYAFTIDSAGPSTTITQAPNAVSRDSTPSFAFSSEAGATFECSFTRGANQVFFFACTSAINFGNFSDGDYTFQVRAKDTAGNTGTPAEHTFTIDTTGPATTIDFGPSPLSRDDSPTFEFSSESGATFECSLSPAAVDFSSCPSPLTYVAQPDGDYTFAVRATDQVGNLGDPVSVNFTIDRTGPVTTLKGDPPAVTSSSTPSFSFSAESGATFECSRNVGDDYVACISPFTYDPQLDGRYVFSVRAMDGLGNTGAPAEHAFTIDTNGPPTIINAAPEAVSDDNTPSFVFSSEPATTFECSLTTSGTGDYSACASPRDYLALADGTYTFQVRATDTAGNPGTPAERVFSIDTSGPATSIDGAPEALSDNNAPTFAFSSEDGATFQCSLTTNGSDNYSACSSPRDYLALADGTYTFKVRATDPTGNTGAPAEHAFSIDTNGPSTTIILNPPAQTNNNTPAFEFSSEPGTTFQCSVSTGSDEYTACTSPREYLALADGAYTFKVRATDSAGNPGSPAVHPFTIDTAGPITSLQGGPPAVTGDSRPTFPFTSEPGATFECSLSSGADAFTACTSPVTFPAQPDGTVTFKVIATDTVGNTGPVTQYTFRIDTTTPSVTIDQAPSSLSSDATPSFVFSSEDGARFECSLTTIGADDYSACESPRDYLALSDGTYAFKVRATDPTGNTGIPAQHAFTIDTAAPSTTITQTPPAQTDDNTPTFTFNSEPGSTFQCSLSAGADDYAACSSPFTYPPQADGTYTFKVRATDPAGNIGTPAQQPFTIMTAAAPTACATATNVITGTIASNTLRGTAGNDVIDALGGNDDVAAQRGNDCVRGGNGADDLKGNAGNDEVIGGDQNDKLAGGAGRDVLLGGKGVDRLYAVDGEVDQVDCGAGANEIAVVDAIDIVVGCERIQVQ